VGRRLDTGDARDNVLGTGMTAMAWTKARSEVVPRIMPRDRGLVEFDLLSGEVREGQEDQGFFSVVTSNLRYIHGGFMAMTWGYVNIVGIS